MGQQHQFQPREASARYLFGQETFSGTRGNERDAPIPAIRPDGRQAVRSTWPAI